VQPAKKPDLTSFDNWSETLLDAAPETKLNSPPSPVPFAVPFAALPAISPLAPISFEVVPPQTTLGEPRLEVVHAPVFEPVQSRTRFVLTLTVLSLLVCLALGGTLWYLGQFSGKTGDLSQGTKEAAALLVSPSGQYATIGAALRHAEPGALIRVAPGVYEESLVLNKQVEIIGDGSPGQVVLQNKNSECLIMLGDSARISKLTIRGQAGQQNKLYHAVSISRGKLILEDCDISSDSLACIAIYGAAADPIIRRCRIHGGKKNGVLVESNGRGLLEDCDIFGNAEVNVKIQEGAQPTLRNCKVHDSKQAGILLMNLCKATLENCTVFDNDWSGIIVQDESEGAIRGCKIQGGKQAGIFFVRSSRGTVENCDISGTIRAGILCQESSSPIIRKCRLHDGKDTGIFFLKNGRGTVTDCDIVDNAFSGITVADGGIPEIQECRIQRNKSYGVYLYTRGSATVRNCDLIGNVRGAFYVPFGCFANRFNNKE
jgi:F-box protein 11